MRMHSFLHAKGKACYRHPVRFASPKGEMDKHYQQGEIIHLSQDISSESVAKII